MRVIALSTLRDYWEHHTDAEDARRKWYRNTSRANWKTPEDVKNDYQAASILPGNRVVFNIKGNQYRLIVAVNYDYSVIYIRFIGTHQEYDKVDAVTI